MLKAANFLQLLPKNVDAFVNESINRRFCFTSMRRCDRHEVLQLSCSEIFQLFLKIFRVRKNQLLLLSFATFGVSFTSADAADVLLFSNQMIIFDCDEFYEC